jgi:hypothetical protein
MRVTDAQRQLTMLRQDVRRLLVLLERQHPGAQVTGQPDSQDEEVGSDVQI